MLRKATQVLTVLTLLAWCSELWAALSREQRAPYEQAALAYRTDGR